MRWIFSDPDPLNVSVPVWISVKYHLTKTLVPICIFPGVFIAHSWQKIDIYEQSDNTESG